MAKKKSDEVHGVKPSVLKALGTGVKDELDAMDESQLNAEIIAAEAVISEVDHAKCNDDRLKAAKEQVSDLASGYRDATKAQRAKVTYSVHRLREMGKL